MTPADGLNTIKAALKYVEQQEEVSCMDVRLLMRWLDIAARKLQAAGNQLSITNFFQRT